MPGIKQSLVERWAKYQDVLFSHFDSRMFFKDFQVFSFCPLLPKGIFSFLVWMEGLAISLTISCSVAAYTGQAAGGILCMETLEGLRIWPGEGPCCLSISPLKLAVVHRPSWPLPRGKEAIPLTHIQALLLTPLPQKACLQSSSSPPKGLEDPGHSLSPEQDLRSRQPWESGLHQWPGHQGLWKTFWNSCFIVVLKVYSLDQQYHLGALQKCKILKAPPQISWIRDSGSGVQQSMFLTIPPGDSDACPSLRTTVLHN